MDTMDAMDRIRQLAAERDLSLYAFARLCGVDYNTLKSAATRGGEFRLGTICRICAGLDIPLSRFFDPEFHLPPQGSAEGTGRPGSSERRE